MKYSGLWFVPSPPNTNDGSTRAYNALITSIESRFPSAARLSPWSLTHRLLRSTPPPQSTPTAPPPSYHHILQFTLLSQSRTYCYIQPVPPPTSTSTSQAPPTSAIKPEPLSRASTPQPHPSSSNTNTASSIISIPTSQSDPHTAFLCTQLSPLWSFRQALQIAGGVTYAIGPYHISLGEVRMSRSGAQAGAGAMNTSSPGVVVAVSILYPDVKAEGDGDGEVDSDDEEGFSFRGGGGGGSGENGTQTQSQTKRSAGAGVDLGVAEQRVRAVWEDVRAGLEFGKVEVREVMMGKEKGGDEGEAEKTVRMWCEVLRLRA
ncbi:hypothetical protein BCR34DRAFT_615163 [Clohesyomyces aquaticus]|uniref:Mediator of RNA polymerase II transcription subunit 20 n=1 Tax=Clohesyomyces aquaticus TaxID=1231657 RepID=A0A1Y1ZKW1_9PLEO|nr:hypothetical protein BCR34DRAFT_615163 [Clohesyomyces aquaticus]